MLYQQLVSIQENEVSTLDNLIPTMPERTEYLRTKTRKSEGPRFTAKQVAKQIKKIRNTNYELRQKRQAEITNEMYHRILKALPGISVMRKTRFALAIRNLRPSIPTLRNYYRSKGETEEHVDLIVTPENLPHLPQVHINKQQMLCLLDVLNGRQHKHAEFIQRGFY